VKKQLLKFLPLIILIVGVGAFLGLASSRKAPERRVVADLGPLVETLLAPAETLQIIVEAQGSVRPADEIDLVPQVSGMVVWKAFQLESGAFFSAGDVLFSIDPRDFELAVTRAQASVARARYQLDLSSEEAAVASQEWQMVRQHREIDAEPTDLVLRLPQVRAAEAELLAAEAGLAEANLRLARTRIVAPFDGRVRQSSLDVGQYVVANQPVSRIYSTERAEIVVAVADEDMAWLVIPQQPPEMSATTDIIGTHRGAEMAAPPRARVLADFAGEHHMWDGFISRAAAELDVRSRMLHLVVEVDAPYAEGPENSVPLLVGMFVDVEILGESVENVHVLPRAALHEDDMVWVASNSGPLQMRRAQMVHVRDEQVLVRMELSPGEQVIVSQLSGATEGMKIRVQSGGARS